MKKIIAANWKNNGSKKFVKDFFDYFLDNVDTKNEIIFFPPDLYIDQVNNYRNKEIFSLGGQNLNTNPFFKTTVTGANSCDMFLDNNCSHILIGHSEVRAQYNDTLIFSEQLKHVNGRLKVIFCIGEEELDRENNSTSEKLSELLDTLVKNFKITHIPVFVAYEPVWAIGSGKTPTLEDILDTHRFIKNKILEKLPSLKEKDIMVLYGGSVNLKNAKDILNTPYVDGVLIGGASLDVKEFTNICNLKI